MGLKNWIDEHPAKIIGGIIVAVATVTAGAGNYLHFVPGLQRQEAAFREKISLKDAEIRSRDTAISEITRVKDSEIGKLKTALAAIPRGVNGDHTLNISHFIGSQSDCARKQDVNYIVDLGICASNDMASWRVYDSSNWDSLFQKIFSKDWLATKNASPHALFTAQSARDWSASPGDYPALLQIWTSPTSGASIKEGDIFSYIPTMIVFERYDQAQTKSLLSRHLSRSLGRDVFDDSRYKSIVTPTDLIAPVMIDFLNHQASFWSQIGAEPYINNMLKGENYFYARVVTRIDVDSATIGDVTINQVFLITERIFLSRDGDLTAITTFGASGVPWPQGAQFEPITKWLSSFALLQFPSRRTR